MRSLRPHESYRKLVVCNSLITNANCNVVIVRRMASIWRCKAHAFVSMLTESFCVPEGTPMRRTRTFACETGHRARRAWHENTAAGPLIPILQLSCLVFGAVEACEHAWEQAKCCRLIAGVSRHCASNIHAPSRPATRSHRACLRTCKVSMSFEVRVSISQ
jgi:hypothetical protein